MNGAGQRGATVVAVVTLVFTPVFKNHHWLWSLVGRAEHSSKVACKIATPCPAKKTVVNKLFLKPTKQQIQLAHGKLPPKPPGR